jgi:hypothetical protein
VAGIGAPDDLGAVPEVGDEEAGVEGVGEEAEGAFAALAAESEGVAAEDLVGGGAEHGGPGGADAGGEVGG